MALTHIFACVLLIVMASLRVRSWRRWEEGADGAKKSLPPSAPAAPAAPPEAAAAAAAATAAAAAAALEDGSSSAALKAPSKKRVTFPGEIEGNGTAAPAAATATAAVTTTTTTTTTAAAGTTASSTPPPRRRSFLLQRPAKLEGFWAKAAEVCICTLRQLLVLFPVTKREYLDMREAWLAAHKLGGGDGGAGKGERGGGCCCERKGSEKEDGAGNCCACGCAASPPALAPISFADYVMKSFDDDVAGIVGLVRREEFLPLLSRRQKERSLSHAHFRPRPSFS